MFCHSPGILHLHSDQEFFSWYIPQVSLIIWWLLLFFSGYIAITNTKFLVSLFLVFSGGWIHIHMWCSYSYYPQFLLLRLFWRYPLYPALRFTCCSLYLLLHQSPLVIECCLFLHLLLTTSAYVISRCSFIPLIVWSHF